MFKCLKNYFSGNYISNLSSQKLILLGVICNLNVFHALWMKCDLDRAFTMSQQVSLPSLNSRTLLFHCILGLECSFLLRKEILLDDPFLHVIHQYINCLLVFVLCDEHTCLPHRRRHSTPAGIASHRKQNLQQQWLLLHYGLSPSSQFAPPPPHTLYDHMILHRAPNAPQESSLPLQCLQLPEVRYLIQPPPSTQEQGLGAE